MKTNTRFEKNDTFRSESHSDVSQNVVLRGKSTSAAAVVCAFLCWFSAGVPGVAAAAPKATAAKSAVPVKGEMSAAELAANRDLEAAEERAAGLTATQRSKLLALMNEGDAEEVTTISGIGMTRFEAIAEARPFTSVGEIALVTGIGEATFASVLAHGKASNRRRTTNPASSSPAGKSATKKRGAATGAGGKKKTSDANKKRSGRSRKGVGPAGPEEGKAMDDDNAS